MGTETSELNKIVEVMFLNIAARRPHKHVGNSHVFQNGY